MRRVIILGSLALFPLTGVAQAIQPVLNEVMYQARAEQWVTTTTAEVTVNINATLNEDQLASAHTDILNKLNKLANAQWHITQFNRTPNESGLEQLLVQAQTRLSEKALGDLRAQAKKISKPGETFTLQSIVFDPTLAEMETARMQLRRQIYQQVQTELVELNKMYPTQHYVVHNLNFNENDVMPQPRMQVMRVAAMAEKVAVQPVSVSNKIILNAMVNLVSVNQ